MANQVMKSTLRGMLETRVLFHPGEAVVWTALGEEYRTAGNAHSAAMCGAIASQVAVEAPAGRVARA